MDRFILPNSCTTGAIILRETVEYNREVYLAPTDWLAICCQCLYRY